jgi:hypothetical protein
MLVKGLVDGVVSGLQSQTDDAGTASAAPRIAEALGAFAFAAYGAAVEVAGELLRKGTYGFAELSTAGANAARAAFIN